MQDLTRDVMRIDAIPSSSLDDLKVSSSLMMALQLCRELGADVD